MLRPQARRLLEVIESIHDLATTLTLREFERPITQATLAEVSSILGEAMRAGWPRLSRFDEAFQILERGIREMNERRGELGNAWLVTEILNPAESAALEGQRLVHQLSAPHGSVH